MAAAAAAEVKGDIAADAAAAAAADDDDDDDGGNIDLASMTIRFRIGRLCTAYGKVTCHGLQP
jgi:hypothetical protein